MKIVVAVDGSPIARHALVEALTLAAQLRDVPEIHVVAVVDYAPVPAVLAKAPIDAPDLLAEEADTALSAAREVASAHGMNVEPHMLRGHVSAQVLKYAESIEAGLIVLGTHGRKGLARTVLGSACERIVRQSHIPVLTVHAA